MDAGGHKGQMYTKDIVAEGSGRDLCKVVWADATTREINMTVLE